MQKKLRRGKSAVLSRAQRYDSEIARHLSQSCRKIIMSAGFKCSRGANSDRNPCCHAWNTAVSTVEFLSSLFLAALLADCSCICASIIFPLVSSVPVKQVAFCFANPHGALQAWSASRAPGNCSPVLFVDARFSLFFVLPLPEDSKSV